MTRLLRFCLIALPCVFAWLSAPLRAAQLLLCGGDEVFTVEIPAPEKGATRKLWSWRAKDHEELPEGLRRAFGSTDDCKPVDGGNRVLISSSGGGCALVEKPSGKVLWFARVPNAHSLAKLPRERVVAASSTDANGDRLALFDLSRNDQPIWETPLPAAHGVVWDETRHCLWALGFDELRRYELKDWDNAKPSLAMAASYPLPEAHGHDLQEVPHSEKLTVTTHSHVYFFDRDKPGFSPEPDLRDTANVKSVSIHPATGRIVFMQASLSDAAVWWSDTLNFLSPPEKVQLKGERLYKARWLDSQGE